MVFRGYHMYGKWFLKACHMVNVFRDLPHGKVVLETRSPLKLFFRDLPHGKCFLDAHPTEIVFQGFATWKIIFRGSPHGKWYLGTYHTENGFLGTFHMENFFQRLATRKVVRRGFPYGKLFLEASLMERIFRMLSQRKWFLGACHTERLMVFRGLPYAEWVLEIYNM